MAKKILMLCGDFTEDYEKFLVKLGFDETKGKRRYLNGSTMFIYECYEPFLKRLQETINVL